jgi:hypothetical protein
MVEETWKPDRQGGNPSCKSHSLRPMTVGEQPYICTHTGECCYNFGHPKEECLDCGLALPKVVIGHCECGGEIILWTMGIHFIGGARGMTERCVKCGKRTNRTPTDIEWEAHSKRHRDCDSQRFEEMKENFAKYKS